MESVILNREGIINLLKNLDGKKANGPDKLRTTLLEITASEIAEAVTFLFAQSYESGQLPNDWRNAHVVPAFKKGENMIPVIIDLSPLLLCYVKSWNIFYRNIMHHLEDNDILFTNQLGCQKNNSCESQLILTVEDLAMNLDHQRRIQDFFKRGCTRLLLYFNTNKPHSFLFAEYQLY